MKMNSSKTKFMSYNSNHTSIKTNDGTALEEVKNFKYLGAWMESTDRTSHTTKQQHGGCVVS